MKKIIALLLSASMLCTGFAINASAEQEGEDVAFKPGMEYSGDAYTPTEEINYSESTATISYSDVSDYTAVGILGALGIMKAAEGSQFKPKAYISRGEFVEGALKTFGVKYEGSAFGKDGSFYDVDESHPQYAAIAAALSAGFISGYEDNTFRPDEVMSYNNAVACIMKALGFSDDYDQSFANNARGKIIKGISVKEPKAITRMEMAQLLYNALDVPMKNVAQFASIGLFRYVDDEFYEDLTDETILNYIWNIHKAEGLLSANYVESVGSEAAREGSVVIDGKRYETKDMNNLDWLGAYVNYYYDKDENLVYMHKNKKVDELIVEADDVIGFNALTRNFSYYDKNGKANNVTLADNYTILYNGKIPEISYDENIFKIKEGRIRFVANKNSKYTYVFIDEYKNFIVNKFSMEDTELKFMLGENMDYFTVDTNYTYIEAHDKNDARKELYRETEDGKETFDTSVFEADSVISVYAPYGSYDANGKLKNTGNYIKIAVSPGTVEGTVKGIIKKDTVKVTIDDKTYNVSKSSYVKDGDIQQGSIQAFYTDFAGEVVKVTSASGGDGWEYAYLVHIVYDDTKDFPSQLVMYNSYGSLEKYSVTESLKINKKKMKAGGAQKAFEASAALIGKPNLKYQQLVKIKTVEKDGEKEITEVQTVLKDYGVTSGYSEDWLSRDASGKFVVYSDSGNVLCPSDSSSQMSAYTAPKYFFSVPATEEKEEKYFDLRAVGSSGSMDVDLYNVDDGLTPKVAIKYESSAIDKPIETSHSGGGASPAMIRDVWRDLDEDGNSVLKFSIAQATGIVEYYSENEHLLDGYVQGDLITLYGNGKKVTSVKPVLYNGKVLGPNNLPDNVEGIAQMSLTKPYAGTPYFFEVYKVVSSSRVIIQQGAITENNKRAVQTSITARNKEWQRGGILNYKEENGRVEVSPGSFDQCVEAEQYGSEKATKMVAFIHEGGARQIIMYTIYR